MKRLCECRTYRGPTEPWGPGNCYLCWLQDNHPDYGGPVPTVAAPQSSWPLLARLAARFRSDSDKGLGDTVARNLHRFGAESLASLYKKITGADCGCADRQAALNRLYPYPPAPFTASNVRRVRIPDETLPKQPSGFAFNGSLFVYQGRNLLAYRSGWAGSMIYVAELRDLVSYDPVRSTALALQHPLANYGREDPRLFVHKGRLHVSFIGVQGRGWRTGITTHQLYARLHDDLTVEQVYAPAYAGRQAWEKNWSFFESDGRLYAVYSIAPHRVLLIDGDRAELAHESSHRWPWTGGELRGGAPPGRLGDEFFHFFHGCTGAHSTRRYNVGCYTFSPWPPFRILRRTVNPLSWDDPATKPRDQYCPTVFPSGAVRDGDTWKVSCGIHDRWLEVWEWPARQVETALSPPDAASD